MVERECLADPHAEVHGASLGGLQGVVREDVSMPIRVATRLLAPLAEPPPAYWSTRSALPWT